MDISLVLLSSGVIIGTLTVVRRLRVARVHPTGTAVASTLQESIPGARTSVTLPVAQMEEAVSAAFAAHQWRRVVQVGSALRTAAPERMTNQMLLMLSQAYYELMRFDDAANVYKDLLIAMPTDPEHHANMAQLEVKRGSVQTAITHMQKAVELDATKAAYLNELAYLYRMNMQHDAAREARRRALELESRKYQ